MSPDALAALHAKAFDRPWSAKDFADLIALGAVVVEETGGFILVRAMAREAEILTLAVDPAHRRKGIARRLIEAAARQLPADTLFLEVAEDNDPAISLYRSVGFEETGRRPRYYHRPDAQMIDALIFARALPDR